MNTHTFRARTLFDARKAARDALGEDAVVLTTREVRRRGLPGFLGGADIEISAARMDALKPEPERARAKGPFAAGAYAPPRPPARDPLLTLRNELRSEIRQVKMALARSPSASTEDLASELAEIRETLEELKADRVGALLSTHGIEGEAATLLTRALRPRSPDLSADLRSVISEMVCADVAKPAEDPLSSSPAPLPPAPAPIAEPPPVLCAAPDAHGDPEGEAIIPLVVRRRKRASFRSLFVKTGAVGVGVAMCLWLTGAQLAHSAQASSASASASATAGKPPAPPAQPAGATPPPSAEASASTDPPSSASPPAPPAPTMGQITIPPDLGGHRVWFDKRKVGESPGTFDVPCGWHSVQVGSAGPIQNIDVKCGGETEVR